MLIYVINKHGKPLMPCKERKARMLLKQNKECFIFGRRSSGYFDLRTLNGDSIHKSASHKKLKLLEIKKSLLTERKVCVSSHD